MRTSTGRRRPVILTVTVLVFAVFIAGTWAISEVLGVGWIYVTLPLGVLLPAVL